MRTLLGGGYTGSPQTHHLDHAARRHVEHATLATETFGPMHMYEPVAVNDNVPVAEQPAGGREPAPGVDLYDEWPPIRVSARRGDFMQTYTGRKFWPLDPRAEDVDIRDIAHSLALQCRYAGHCIQFYSVAEHCVHISRWLQRVCGPHSQAALYGLMHDAAEAYTVDVPRPLKRHLVGYKEAEADVMAAICDAFKMDREFPPIVHEADTRIIADELSNLRWMSWHTKHDDPLGVSLKYWSPVQAEIEFLAEFAELMGVRAAA